MSSIITEIKSILVQKGLPFEGGDPDHPYFNSTSLSYRDPGGNEADIVYNNQKGFELKVIIHNPFEGKDTVSYIPLKSCPPLVFVIYSRVPQEGIVDSLVQEHGALGHPEVVRFMEEQKEKDDRVSFLSAFIEQGHYCW